jgi:hypothetical protein
MKISLSTLSLSLLTACGGDDALANKKVRESREYAAAAALAAEEDSHILRRTPPGILSVCFETEVNGGKEKIAQLIALGDPTGFEICGNVDEKGKFIETARSPVFKRP